MESRESDSLIGHNEFQNVFRQLLEYKMLIRADADLTIEDVTNLYAEMLGTSRKDIIGKPYIDFISHNPYSDKTDSSNIATAFRKVIAKKQPQAQHVFRHDLPDPVKKGNMLERYWQITLYPIFNKNHEVAHIMLVSSNATQAVSSMRELEVTRRHLEEALEAGKVASWTWELGGEYLQANSGLAELFGVPVSKISEGLRPSDFVGRINKEDRERVVGALHRTIETGEEFYTEFRVGKSKWMLGRAKLIVKDSIKILSGVSVDVTEQRNLLAKINLAKRQEKLNREEAKLLHERNKELESINKTKEEFVALASHQLRTPATAVKQYLGMVLQGYAGEITNIQADMLQKAFESNERQIQIINQILNTARADTGRLIMTFSPVDIVALTKSIAEEARSSIEAHEHSFIVKTPKKSIILSVDSGYFRMALENLLNNADKYTPEGGLISIVLTKMKSNICISVKDTGVGIPKEDFDKLFVKFSRIHNPLSIRAGGSGIGLYLAAEIVRLHKGAVRVNSKIGEGTTFTIELPTQSKV